MNKPYTNAEENIYRYYIGNIINYELPSVH